MNIYINKDQSYHIFIGKLNNNSINVEKTLFYMGLENPLVPLAYGINDRIEQLPIENAAYIVLDDLFHNKIDLYSLFSNIYSDK